MDNLLPWILAISTIVLSIIILVLVLVSERRRKEKLSQQASSLGMAPIDAPDPAFVGAVTRLLQREEDAVVHLENIFQQSLLDGMIYLFDFGVETEDTKVIHRGAIAIQSTSLVLPRFSLFSKTGPEGDLPDWVDRVVDSLVGLMIRAQGIGRVNLTNVPDLDRRFVLLARDETAIRTFLTSKRIRALAELQAYCALDADGDLLVLGLLPLPGDVDASPANLHREALHLYRSFQAR